MLTLIKKVKTLMTVIIKNTLSHETFNSKDICNVLDVIIINDDIRSRSKISRLLKLMAWK